jgi:peptidoglycan endopeptidase LytE
VDLNWFRGTEIELYQFANVQPGEEITYTVKDGDTFHSIAESHGLSLTELLDANPSLLNAGSTLKIPGQVEIPTPTDDSGTNSPTDMTETPVDTTEGTTTEKTHIVKMGDTLSSIALKYGTTVNAIMAINPQITNQNIIFDGQEIKIP